jgi:hypothetical protein
MKNQILSMALAWLVSAGLMPESATTAITDLVGIQGYEKPFELAAVIVLGFIFQTVKPLIELLPRLTQRYADKITAELDLPSTETKAPLAAPKTPTKKVTASKGK